MHSDAELVRRLAGGDLPALGELYERHWRHVYSVLQHRLRSADAAKDLLSEVFLALPLASKRYRDQGNVRGWLVGIALRKALEQHRKNRVIAVLGKLWGAAAPSHVEPSRAVEARLELERLLGALSEPMRMVMELRVVHGLEAAEIAAALGINEKTVWTRMHRARAELKRLAADEGEELAGPGSSGGEPP